MIACAVLEAACIDTAFLRIPEGRSDWVTDGNWIARPGSIPATARPMSADRVDALIVPASRARREAVKRRKWDRERGLAFYAGESGETAIQVRFERLLDGLRVFRLTRGIRDGRLSRRPVHERPLAGINKTGELVVLIMPWVVHVNGKSALP